MKTLVLYGEDHTPQYREIINGLIRKRHKVKPFDYLVLEELGPFSYFTKEEKEDAIKREAYSVGPEGLRLAIELDIPAIGMDLWADDVYKDDKFDDNDFAVDVVRSFKLREANMLNVLMEYHKKGNVASIVGDTHLRKTVTKQLGAASPLYTYFNGLSDVTIVRCPHKELE